MIYTHSQLKAHSSKLSSTDDTHVIETRERLKKALENYQTDFTSERVFKEQFLSLLKHPRSYFRDHLPGHVTGSVWIIDESKQFVLLTHHAKLNRWLQPGGHADGDENIMAVALREATEETGLKNLRLLTESIFDIDIHTIPARKDFPEHQHYDIRFLLEAFKEEPLLVSEESHEIAWKKVQELPLLTQENNSMIRMATKVSLL
jgi:8-oxo-dGTP pyrophosphatase MutT (NUDIX family)